jgi:hypothetical protein
LGSIAVWPCGQIQTFRRNILLLTPSSPENGGNIFLRNVGIYLQVYAVLTEKTNIDN